MDNAGVRCRRCHKIIPILNAIATSVFDAMTDEEWDEYLSFVSQSPFINGRIR